MGARKPGIRTYFELGGRTASDIEGQLAEQQGRLRRRLSSVRRTLAVLSGKGGVGKSIVTASLAAELAGEGFRVGVLDADLNGPSMARLLGVPRTPLRVTERGVEPGIGAADVRVMSMDLLLAGESAPVDWTGPRSESFVWRGTLEANALREFLADTAWGELDYLLLDLPPGPDRIAPIRDLVARLGGVLAVTVPSDLSRFVVGKSLRMAEELGVPVIGYVVNMSGYACPHCERIGPLFEGGGEGFEGVARLADIPFQPEFGRRCDAGEPYVLDRPESPVGEAVRRIAGAVRNFFDGEFDSEGP